MWAGKAGGNYLSCLKATNDPGWLETLQKVPFRGEECGPTQHLRRWGWDWDLKLSSSDRTYKVLDEQCPSPSHPGTGTVAVPWEQRIFPSMMIHKTVKISN